MKGNKRTERDCKYPGFQSAYHLGHAFPESARHALRMAFLSDLSSMLS